MAEKIGKAVEDEGNQKERKIRDVDEESEVEEDAEDGEPTKIGLIRVDTKKLDYIPVQSKIIPFSDK